MRGERDWCRALDDTYEISMRLNKKIAFKYLGGLIILLITFVLGATVMNEINIDRKKDLIVLLNISATKAHVDGDLNTAINHLSLLKNFTPEEIEPYYNLGRIYFSLGLFDMARVEFEEIVKRDSSSYKNSSQWIPYTISYCYLGAIYSELDAPEKSYNILSDVLKLEPNLPDVLLGHIKKYPPEGKQYKLSLRFLLEFNKAKLLSSDIHSVLNEIASNIPH